MTKEKNSPSGGQSPQFVETIEKTYFCDHCGKQIKREVPLIKVDRELMLQFLSSLANWADEFGGQLLEDVE